ncbi:MAG: hypothetical protein IT428_33580, partial [Planctomycetaceae bacterium]|nr:hypothetical protein [Planctomycetaceae bacterium]
MSRNLQGALTVVLLLAAAPHTRAEDAATAETPSPPTATAGAKPDAAKLEYFEKRVRPLLVNNCHACHSADTNSKGGLRVDDRNGLIAGGGRGSAVVPGDPDKSLLIKAVSHADKGLKMPPGKKLEDEEIAVLTQWIKDGAVWPAVELPAELG